MGVGQAGQTEGARCSDRRPRENCADGALLWKHGNPNPILSTCVTSSTHLSPQHWGIETGGPQGLAGQWTPGSVRDLVLKSKVKKGASKRLILSHICIQPPEILNDSWASTKLRGPMSHLATGLLGTFKQDIGAPVH